MWLLLLFLCADPFDTALRAGLLALNASDLPTAQAQLEAASQFRKDDGRVWLALAQTYWRQQERGKADTAAAKAEVLAKDAALLRPLAFFYAETGNARKTADVVHRVLDTAGSNENDYFGLADLCLKHQFFESALDAASAGRRAFPKSAQLALIDGVALYGLRRFPDAIDAFLATIELDPGADQPYTFLGRMVEDAGDRLPRIQTAFAGFAHRSPDNYLSVFLYAKSLSTSDSKQAEALLLKSIALNDNFWGSHFELGVVLDEQHHFTEAAVEMKRAIELNPEDPVAHYRMARLYERLGKPDDARSERELHRKLAVKHDR